MALPDRNQYVEMSLTELCTSMQETAGRFLKHGTMVSVDVGHQLLAAAIRLSPEVGQPDSAHRRVREGGSVIDEFWPRYVQLVREARYRILVQAIDAAKMPPFWIRDHRLDGEKAYDIALRDDEGLVKVLEHLSSQTNRVG